MYKFHNKKKYTKSIKQKKAVNDVKINEFENVHVSHTCLGYIQYRYLVNHCRHEVTVREMSQSKEVRYSIYSYNLTHISGCYGPL